MALEVAQGVLPLVGAEIRRAAALLADLQAQDIRGIARRAGNVTRAQAYVADVAQPDHELPTSRSGGRRGVVDCDWYSEIEQSIPHVQYAEEPDANWHCPASAPSPPPSPTTLAYTP